MKIVFLDASTMGPMNLAKVFASYGEYVQYDYSEQSQVVERVRGATIVITNKVKIGADVFEKLPEIRLVCVAATGTNNIDLESAGRYGVEVRNVKGYSTDSVAQQTFALLLNLLNHVSYYDSYVKSPDGYPKSRIFSCLDKPVYELKGKTVGIIGLGEIGKKVADLCVFMGAEVVYYSTSGKNNDSSHTRASLDELLQISDIVSIHAPLNDQTYKLIGYRQLESMRRHAILINTGRGGIVDEADLARALDAGVIATAALDVFETEPIKADNPLLSIKSPEKLLLSPHIAWASVEARKTLLEGIIKNIEAFVKK